MSCNRIPIVVVTWTETERGWGCRPDGASIHLNMADWKAFEKAYWDRMPKEVPHEYSRPDGPQMVDADPELRQYLLDAKAKGANGIWVHDRYDEKMVMEGKCPWSKEVFTVWIVGVDGTRMKDTTQGVQRKHADARVKALEAAGLKAEVVQDPPPPEEAKPAA